MSPPSSLRGRFDNLALRKKILLPFFLILIVLGTVAAAGTQRLIRAVLIETANQRLNAIQELIFREIKKQEQLLLTYASMVEFQQYATLDQDKVDPKLLMMQDNLLYQLSSAKVVATLYPADGSQAYGPLSELLHHAASSGKPRFRFLASSGLAPALCAAVPIVSSSGDNRVLLLQTPLDATFLKQIVLPFRVNATLLGLNHQTLVTTDKDVKFRELNDEQVARLVNGEKIAETVDLQGSQRQIYSAIPLGSSDMVLLAVNLPLADLDLLLMTLATRAGLTILFALMLGGWIYYRLIREITAPITELLTATEELSEGNLGFRINTRATGELKQLAESFNQMLCHLDDLYQQKADQARDLALANEQLNFKKILEFKNQEIERTNLELKQRLHEISMLLQLNQVMSSSLDLSIIFDRTLNLLREILDSADIVLFLYNQETDELNVRKTVGVNVAQHTGVAFRLSEGVTGHAARTRELLYILDIAKDARYLSYKTKKRDKGSLVSAPILANNRLVGVLNLHKPQIDAFTGTELEIIRAATNQLAIAIINAQLFEKTRMLSNTDELTNVANRRYFQTMLQREHAYALRYESNFSLIMIDIDHFKEYNDTYGHLNGDAALSQIANILLQNTRGIDLVARYGGEEFSVLLPNTTMDNAFVAAEKLRMAVENQILTPVANNQIHNRRVTISLGISAYPDHGTELEVLFERADRALYHAKETGRNRTICWNDQIMAATDPQRSERFQHLFAPD